MEVLKKLFSPEFRNRLDAIIQFEPLDEQSVARVVDKLIVELEAQLDKNEVTIELEPAARDWVAVTRLRQEDGRSADGSRDPRAHQAAARGGAPVRQARGRRPRPRRGRVPTGEGLLLTVEPVMRELEDLPQPATAILPADREAIDARTATRGARTNLRNVAATNAILSLRTIASHSKPNQEN